MSNWPSGRVRRPTPGPICDENSVDRPCGSANSVATPVRQPNLLRAQFVRGVCPAVKIPPARTIDITAVNDRTSVDRVFVDRKFCPRCRHAEPDLPFLLGSTWSPLSRRGGLRLVAARDGVTPRRSRRTGRAARRVLRRPAPWLVRHPRRYRGDRRSSRRAPARRTAARRWPPRSRCRSRAAQR
jgi:hypothetical protein